jgi:hypothetical protein
LNTPTLLSDSFESPETLSQLINDILLDKKEMPEDFDDRFITCCKSMETNSNALILKNVFFCPNLPDTLIQIEKQSRVRYSISKLLTVEYAMTALSSSTGQVSLVFKSILLCARVLPAVDQEALYKEIGRLYFKAKQIAKKDSRESNIFFPFR